MASTFIDLNLTAANIANVPAGNISSTTVQAAINELDSEKQPIDATLTALAAYNTNGLITQTAADTFTGRTLTAADSSITVADGNGVAGNPTISLPVSGVTAAQYVAPVMTVNAKGIVTAIADLTPAHGITLKEDFIATTAVGNLGWTGTANSGTNGMNSSSGSGTIMGIYRGDTSTSSTSAPTLSLGNGVSMVLGLAETTYEMKFHVASLSTVGEEFIIRVGLHNSTTSAAPVNGVFFEYDRLSSVNWRLRALQNSVGTVTTSATAVAAAAWMVLKCVINSAGTSAEFFVDGVSLGTVTSNIPTTITYTVAPTLQIIKSAGTTSRVYYIDWFRLYVKY